MKQGELVMHCWEPGPSVEGDFGERVATVCMLPEFHRGEHEWSRADEVRMCCNVNDREGA